MKAWNGYTLICDCGSENIESQEDENHSMEDYAVYKCLDCGEKFKIELPN